MRASERYFHPMATTRIGLQAFGLDCWGWYMEVDGLDAKAAGAIEIADAPSNLDHELPELANSKEQTPSV